MRRVTWALFAAGVALVACGRTVTLGDEKFTDGGAGGTAGNAASGGSAANSASGEAGVSGAPGGEAGASGAPGGEAGASGAPGGSSGTGAAAGRDAGTCKVARPPPAPNPTAAEQERAELVRAFCQNVGDHGCIDSYLSLSGVSAQAGGCSTADKVLACELDELYLYWWYVPEECDDEWRAALSCGAKPEFAQACVPPVSLVAAITHHGVGPGPCDPEKLALNQCRANSPGRHRSQQITGTRTTCEYYTGPGQDGSTCSVTCRMPGNTPIIFQSTCSGAPGLPLECGCMVNGSIITDYGADDDNSFFAADCQHAAQLMADGHCVNRLDCCFTQTKGLDGGSQCRCTSDPSQLSQPTCEALATDREGQVVDICPKYKLD